MIGSFYPEVFHWTLGTPGLLSTRDLLTAGLLNLPQRGKGSQVSHGHLLLVIPEVMRNALGFIVRDSANLIEKG